MRHMDHLADSIAKLSQGRKNWYIRFVGNYYPFIAILNMMYVCTASGNDNQLIQKAIHEKQGHCWCSYILSLFSVSN